MSMKVDFNLPKVCRFMSFTNKMVKNAHETQTYKTTEEIRNNAITVGFLAPNTLYHSNYGRLDAMHIQCVEITINTLKTAFRKS